MNNLYIKFKLFYPVFIGSIIAIALITLVLVGKSKQEIYKQAENSMKLEVKTIRYMFERERELKMEKVKTELKVAHELFYRHPISFSGNKIQVEAVDQNTLDTSLISIPAMMWNNTLIYQSTVFPDATHDLFGGTTTIFQKIDSGFLRISTNVLNSAGKPAVGTFIPNDSPVVKTIGDGKTYQGRAFVVNDWYITSYEPFYYHDTLAGMLYVGDKEKDLDKLRRILQKLKIGQEGSIFVIDQNGEIIIGTTNNAQSVANELLIKNLITDTVGSSLIFKSSDHQEYLLSSTRYDPFGFIIAALIPTSELTYLPIKNIIVTAVYFAILISIMFILMVLLTTTRRVHRLLNAIRLSNIKLRSAKDALRQSEYNFRTLFNNSSDEMLVSDMQGNIIEMNEMACQTLEYGREELLEMNILDLKPEKFGRLFFESRDRLKHTGSLIFDSEYITKSGKTIPVEINSRLLDFNQQNAVLSISRNLKLRNELERKVLSAVIQTEERERERFSKDMHDGLGPMLSTVKLYVGELADAHTTEEEKINYIKQVNEIIDEAVSSTREISNNLMPRVIHEYGVVKAIQAFCNKINLTNRIKIDFNSSGVDQTMDKNIQLILFRVISELINNTIKHAKATLITIDIVADGEKIRVEFNDNGIGFNTEKIMSDKRIGIGLKSIISRIKSINGSCRFSSEEGHGFKIIIEI
ncbi:MAG: Cache 3/Cache 2 fusion domain-containing protein [Bacteroidales bacterium]|jgi:PAS domain S-box-containing protein